MYRADQRNHRLGEGLGTVYVKGQLKIDCPEAHWVNEDMRELPRALMMKPNPTSTQLKWRQRHRVRHGKYQCVSEACYTTEYVPAKGDELNEGILDDPVIRMRGVGR